MSGFLEFYISGFIVVLVLAILFNEYIIKKYKSLSLSDVMTLSLFIWSFILEFYYSAYCLYNLYSNKVAKTSNFVEFYTSGLIAVLTAYIIYIIVMKGTEK